jgi:hypothetical protein
LERHAIRLRAFFAKVFVRVAGCPNYKVAHFIHTRTHSAGDRHVGRARLKAPWWLKAVLLGTVAVSFAAVAGWILAGATR